MQCRCELIEAESVETVKQLRDAIGAMQGPGRDDRYLDKTYRAELWAETLSDGSVAYSVVIREAEPI